MKAGTGEMYQPYTILRVHAILAYCAFGAGRPSECVHARAQWSTTIYDVNRADHKCRHVTDARQKIGGKQRGLQGY